MKISISELTAKMAHILKAKGYAEADIPFAIHMYLGGELRGHTSHGLASFVAFAQSEPAPHIEPTVLKDTHALLALDARGAPGNVLGRRAADEAVKRAKAEGVGTVLIKDMDSWLRPGAIAEYIAQQGLLAVVMNTTGGTQQVAPPGGFEGALGTNPIAYGIPTTGEPLVVDMATSEHAWGQVRLANKYDTPLPADAFYDDQGNITRDGKAARSVKTFGGYKGFALALLIEVMSGSLVGMDITAKADAPGTFGSKMPLRGAVVMAFDPSVMTDPEEFKKQNSDLLDKMQNSRPLPGKEIRLPGMRAGKLKAENTKNDSIDIADELWKDLQSL